MLAQDSFELIERCYQQSNCLIEKEEFKQKFIEFVFTDYQEEVVKQYGLDMFFEHLEDLKLSHCRKDFDLAVEEWYEFCCSRSADSPHFHDNLFHIVKEVVSTEQPKKKEDLMQSVTVHLTSPEGLMKKWRVNESKSISKYFKHLDRLGIKKYEDIEALIEAWLMEFPNAFDPEQQKRFNKQTRRGRPNNVELCLLVEKVQEIKPDLSKVEKERLRKIYYYYRKTLTTLGMLEKFLTYISAKSEREGNARENKSKSTTWVI